MIDALDLRGPVDAYPPQTGTLSEYAYDLEAVGEEIPKEAREIGAAANAILGLYVIPTLLRRMQGGAPVGVGTYLASALLGGFLGYWKPLPITLIQGMFLISESEL